jgi:RimJ/RimL family protein N-acetyltransferase
MTRDTTIHAPRLDLRPATPDDMRAELAGHAALADALGARIPAGWPPELYDADAIRWTLARLEETSEPAWYLYHVLRRDDDGGRTAVGVCGFKGPPDDEGTVELGYGVLEEHRRQGYAVEAVRALLDAAFDDVRVTRVAAETLPELEPSIGVLRRCGFHLRGEGSEPGVIRYEKTRGEHAAEGGA